MFVKEKMVVFAPRQEALINNYFLNLLSDDISVFTVQEAGTHRVSAFVVGLASLCIRTPDQRGAQSVCADVTLPACRWKRLGVVSIKLISNNTIDFFTKVMHFVLLNTKER